MCWPPPRHAIISQNHRAGRFVSKRVGAVCRAKRAIARGKFCNLRRIYPQGPLTCHITGYVSPVTQREIEKDKSLEILPTLSTGKTGVEFMFERNLRGMPGREKIEVNATAGQLEC